MYNDIIEFGRIKYTKNEYGQEKETIEWREVYAEVTSVSPPSMVTVLVKSQ